MCTCLGYNHLSCESQKIVTTLVTSLICPGGMIHDSPRKLASVYWRVVFSLIYFVLISGFVASLFVDRVSGHSFRPFHRVKAFHIRMQMSNKLDIKDELLHRVRIKGSPSAFLQKASTLEISGVDDPVIFPDHNPGRRYVHVKSLVWEYDGCPVLLLLPLNRQVDRAALASYLDLGSGGESRIMLASKDRTTSLTGYQIGTIPPIGHKTPLRTIIDYTVSTSVSQLASEQNLQVQNTGSDQVQVTYVCGGSGDVNFNLCLPYDDLLKLSFGEVAYISCERLSERVSSMNDQLSQSSSEVNVLTQNSTTVTEDNCTVSDIPLTTPNPISDDSAVTDVTNSIYSMSVTITSTHDSVDSTEASLEINTDSSQNPKSHNVTSTSSGSVTQSKPKIASKESKQKRAEKWKAANKTLSVLSGSDNMGFSAKLLRDYAWLEESSLFYSMIHLFDLAMTQQNTEEGKIQLQNELNNATSTGKTALHLAAWKGPIGHLRALLSRGANIDQYSTSSGNYGKSAIFYAITQCRDEVVLELLHHNACVKIVNNKGQTPLSLSITHLMDSTIQQIEQAELRQADKPWVDFRQTHGDGKLYGDLDPRFIDLVNGTVQSPFSTSLLLTHHASSQLCSNTTASQSCDTGSIKAKPSDGTEVDLGVEGSTSTDITANLSPCGRVLFPTTRATRRLLQRRLCDHINSSNNDLNSDTAIQDNTVSKSDDSNLQSVSDRISQLKQSTDSVFSNVKSLHSSGEFTEQPSMILSNSIPVAYLADASALARVLDAGSEAATDLPSNAQQMLIVEAVVVSKRHISKTLVFLNVVPKSSTTGLSHPSSSMNSLTSFQSEKPTVFDKYSWTVEMPSSNNIYASEWNSKFALQLIIGKTMREELGTDATFAVCRKLKYGQLIRAVGTIVADSERGSENLQEYRTIDFVVSKLDILQDDFIESELLSNRVSDSTLPVVSDDSTICRSSPAQSTSKDSSLVKKAVASSASLSGSLSEPSTEQVGEERISSSVSESLPVMTLERAFDPSSQSSQSTHTFVTGSSVEEQITSFVTVVDSHESVQAFHRWVRGLSLAASQHVHNTSSTSSNSDTSSGVVVGLDCEWRPSMFSNSVYIDDGADNQFTDHRDAPVATLQLATTEHAFIIDLQTITTLHSVEKNFHTSDTYSSMSHAYLSDIQTLLSLSLTELFSHKHITLLGYSVAQDLRKLAASYPHWGCFQRFHHVVDVALLASVVLSSKHIHTHHNTHQPTFTSPVMRMEIDKGVTVSLSKLCEMLLGCSLDKTQQCSSWHIRPLTTPQIIYAALDAAVLPKLYTVLLEKSNQLPSLTGSGKLSLWRKNPRLCLNYKFTTLHVSGQFIDTSNVLYTQLQQRYGVDTVTDDQWMNELCQLAASDGKIRRELNTVLASQSWSYLPTSGSPSNSSSGAFSSGIYKEPSTPTLQSLTHGSTSTSTVNTKQSIKLRQGKKT